MIKNLKKEITIGGIALGIALGVGLMSVLIGSNKGEGYVIDTENNANPSTEEYIVADLGGAVVSPGLYKLDKGSRVGELIDIAGGILNDASKNWVARNLNLSQVLEDSQKVYIPFEWDIYREESVEIASLIKQESTNYTAAVADENTTTKVTGASSGESANGAISINNSTQEELKTLNGVGEVYAQRIIDARPYHDMNDFYNRVEIPESTLQKIKDAISL